ncbi:BBP7 family outer membrane beta-barrel protein [Rhodopirellula sp.]|nr:BBP7 family outer membrane beta-barrel protein [Rhodopirellula sp.]MDB4678793.1 BBP7 family outer membrane beta-barrel protein [Rhodopirellula sp.]
MFHGRNLMTLMRGSSLTGLYRLRSFTPAAILLMAFALRAEGQVRQKGPDRGTYQPPVVILDTNGEPSLMKAGVPPVLLPAPNKSSLSAAKVQSKENIDRQPHQTMKNMISANEIMEANNARRQASYQHLPHRVVADADQAAKLLKPGEEGNRWRPLMEVALEDAVTRKVAEKMSSHGRDSQPVVPNTLADLIARDQITNAPLSGTATSTASESSVKPEGIIYPNDLVQQVSHEEVENPTTDKPARISEHTDEVQSASAARIGLERYTRFATLPLLAGKRVSELAHDSTCDGCDACEMSSCDEIGCGVFGCEEHDVECDTLGCDAIGGYRSQDGRLENALANFSLNSLLSVDEQWFGGVDYLMMWRRGIRLPALVSTEVSDGLNTTDVTLVGEDRILTRMGSGVRLTIGNWLNRDQTVGVVGRGWYGGRKAFDYQQDQTQNATILRPFLDVTDELSPTAEAQVIASPGRADGVINIDAYSEAFGADLSIRQFLGAGFGTTVDVLYGYQFLRFNERLSIQSDSVSLDDDFAPIGSTISVMDKFQTANEFHGAQLGLQADYREGWWSFQGLAKLAFGSLSREALRVGETTTQVDALTSTEAEGLLVRGTNSGRLSDQHFSWVPELDATLGWHRYEGWDLTLGYHLIAVTDAIQPCGTIDPNLAVNLSDPLTGAVSPTPDLRYRTFFLHGIHFGLQRTY